MPRTTHFEFGGPLGAIGIIIGCVQFDVHTETISLGVGVWQLELHNYDTCSTSSLQGACIALLGIFQANGDFGYEENSLHLCADCFL